MLKIIFLILLFNYEILSFPQTIVTKTTAPTIAETTRYNINNHIIKEEKFYEKVEKDKHKCGYESCPNALPNMLNVHLVPHTHDDVGWLKTVDQYYYGSRSMIQKAGVQYILDSVVQELLKDPKKRFIYVESAFFFKWWHEQTDELKTKVKELVNEGRLEFIGGAWSMNDEATTHYQSIIDQFTWGLRLLNDTFGECGRPRVGWQIDPFGHSREMASIFAQMGFDGLFFGRLDYQDKRSRLNNKEAEFIWNGSPLNLGDTSDLFTGVLYNNYGPPPGFCFDILCADEPIIDAPYSPDNNVKEKVDKFLYYIDEQAKYYRTNNIILTMGGDFTYMDANSYFRNMDKLIRYANDRQKNGSNINLFYSTPSCYLKSLKDADIKWPTKNDDFFPYASDPHAFWTGYFTSRPTLKRFERVGNQFLQICKQLTALSKNKEKFFDGHLNYLREVMGVMQHHDAVTGTEKQAVAEDYAWQLNMGIAACESNTKYALNQLSDDSVTVVENIPENYHHQNEYKIKTKLSLDFKNCLLLNISKCEISENSNTFILTVYNPMPQVTFDYIRIPVTSDKYFVLDYRGVPVDIQYVPIPQSVNSLNFRFSNATYELVMLANDIPNMGYRSYFVTTNFTVTESVKPKPDTAYIQSENIMRSTGNKMVKTRRFRKNESVAIGNKDITVNFNENGLVSSVSSFGVTAHLAQQFIFYEGAIGNNAEYLNRSSGAYIFRPNNTEKLIANRATIEVYRGALVEEVHQRFNEWLSQVVRVYKHEYHVEFEWMVGAIPVDDKIGKEIITRFLTDISSNGTFYTDSNGREMIKRMRDYRETWNLHLDEKIAGNYYPVTTKIAIEDAKIRMAVLTDRAQGGSSIFDGSLELMVHRRLLHDDAFGVGEALNESAYGQGLVARGKHFLFFGPRTGLNPSLQAQERFLQRKKLLSPWPFFSDATGADLPDWQKKYTNIFSGMTLSLPINVNLFSFEPWGTDSYLVRFEHLLEANEDEFYSKPVTFSIKEIFANLDISEIRETTLAGNQWLDQSKRMKFRSEAEGYDYQPTSEYVSNERDNLIKYENHRNQIRNEDNSDETVLKINLEKVEMLSKTNREDDKKWRKVDALNDFTVTLGPMEIRTFIIILNFSP